MKRIELDPYVSLSLIILFSIGATMLILHAITLVNFQYVTEQQAITSF